MLHWSAEQVRRAGYSVLVACAYFGFPIAAAAPVVLGMPSRPLSIAYRVLVAAGSVLYAWWVGRRWRAPLARPVQWAVGLLGLMLLARLAWDSIATRLPLDLAWDDMWAQSVVFALLPALPFLLLPNCRDLAVVRRVCEWAAVIAVAAIAAGAMYSIRHAGAAGRLATDVINPITIGEVGVALFILAASKPMVGGSGHASWWRRGARVAGALLGAMVCVLSASKGPLLSLAFVAMVMFAYRLVRLPPRRQMQEGSAALLLLGVVGALVVVLNQYGVLAIYGRIADVASDQSTAMRLQAWDGALAQFNSSPLWGSAAVELSTRFYPHNAVLEVMMATGIGGLLLLLLLQAWGLFASHWVLSNAPQYSWVVLLFLQHGIGAMLSGSVYFSGATWISMLMLLGVYQSLQAEAEADAVSLAADAST